MDVFHVGAASTEFGSVDQCSLKETGLSVYNYIVEVEVRGSRIVKGLQDSY